MLQQKFACSVNLQNLPGKNAGKVRVLINLVTNCAWKFHQRSRRNVCGGVWDKKRIYHDAEQTIKKEKTLISTNHQYLYIYISEQYSIITINKDN